MKTSWAMIAAVMMAAFAGCGGGTETGSTAAGAEAAASTGAKEITIINKAPTTRHLEDVKPDEADLVGSEPKPIIPDGPPPGFLAYQKLIEGDGKVARYGDRVAIQFVGAAYKNGRVYTSRWDWRSPYVFEVGSASLLKGFDIGVEGMKVGDRRELIIPPEYADPTGTLGGIPDKETVIYMVDLLAVE